MTDEVMVTVAMQLRWWVRPLIWVAARIQTLGVPINVDALAKWVATHGATMRIE